MVKICGWAGGCLLAASGPARAQIPRPPTASVLSAGGAPSPLQANRLSAPPVIDGALDDEAWTAQPLPTGPWRSYNPLHGETIPQQTQVWVAYDADALYFAFQCDDPEPSGIKTSITRRDNIWSDDWVGLSLDALGTGQTSYHLMVNPSGVQLDMINTIAGYEDTSPDWIWESAARINDRGYAVEIRVPLQTIRFKGGADLRMGILFWRRVSRTGFSVAWPALEPGKWVFDKHALIGFTDLRARPTRELIPSATFSTAQERATPGTWDGADRDGDLGLSAKWGVTSRVTLDATINPDFSQVESDAFQVEINQRYPVFFSEKRPFFMEGAGLFNVAGNAQGDSSMLYAVHTRRIVDPILGAKVTGSAGKLTFGTLTALDQAPGRTEDPADPLSGREKFFQVARGQFGLGAGSFAGVIGTLTQLAGRTNAVGGADLSLSFKGVNRITAFVLTSGTDDAAVEPDSSPAADRPLHGFATQLGYGFSSRRSNFQTQLEHYDRGFAMDTAFLNRVGFTAGWVYSDYNFYPDSKGRYRWVRRIVPFTFVQGGRDRIQGGDEHVVVGGLRLSLTRQGFFRFHRVVAKEPWQGQEYHKAEWRASGNMQVYRWLRPYANVNWGSSLYYDEVNPFVGDTASASAGATIQIGGRFSENVDFTRAVFDRRGTGERVYTVNVVNTRTTYQFTRQLAARAIIQYDSQRARVLTDFLGSWDVRPGTVLYAGYGSLYERRGYEASEWIPGQGVYLGTRRGLFLKASYLYRF